MADTVKISGLPSATTTTGADYVPIVQGGITKKAPLNVLGTGAGIDAVSDIGLQAHWSMDSVPEIPDDPAGVTYLQDAFASVPPEYGVIGSGVLSVSGGILLNTLSATTAYILLTSALGTLKTVKFKYKSPRSGVVTLRGTVDGVGNVTVGTYTVVANQWIILDAYVTGNLTAIYVQQSGMTIGDILQLDWVYIGTGAYLPNSLIDNSGNGNHGTIYGATPVPGISGKALAFDGVKAYVSCPISSALKTTFSASAWITPSSVTGAQRILHSYGSSPYTNGGWSLYLNGTSLVIETLSQGGILGTTRTVISQVSIGVSCFIGFTFSSGVVTLYKNGVSIGSWTQTITDIGTYSTLLLGQIGTGTNWFSGTIDEPRIYNRALSAEEVYSLYMSKGRGPDCHVKSIAPLKHAIAIRNDIGFVEQPLTTVSDIGLQAHWSMDSVPEIPDAPSPDTTYLQDAWATVDGWLTTTGALSFASGILTFIPNTAPNNFGKDPGVPAMSGKNMRIKIRASIATSISLRKTGYTVFKSQNVLANTWTLIDGEVGTAADTLVWISSTALATLEIDFIYIGTGAYLPNSLIDNSGNGNHGTIYGATPVEGISGRALAFDGVNDYCSIPNFVMPNIFAFSAWVNGPRSLGRIINMGANATPQISLFREAANDILWIRGYSGSTVVDRNINNYFLDYNSVDVLVGVIIDWSTKAVSIYRNGVLFSTTVLTGADKPSTGTLYIGTYQGVSGYYLGTIDEPRIYNRALSAEEVYSLYMSKGRGPDCQVKSVAAIKDSLVVRDTVGNIQASGVKFTPAGLLTAGTSTDPNTLDDFEEGSWTPVYATGTGAFGAVTYDALTLGKYTKIGNAVSIVGVIRTDSITIGTASGGVRIAGLPFTNNSSVNSAISIGYSVSFGGDTPTMGAISAGTSSIILYYRATANGGATLLDASDLGLVADNNHIIFSGIYLV